MSGKSALWLAGGIGVVVGSVIGFVVAKKSELGFEPKLSLDEAVSIVVTGLVGALVVTVLDKRGQDFRSEKEILLRRTDRVSDLFDQLRSIAGSLKYDYGAAASLNKRIGTTLVGLQACLEKRGFSASSKICGELLTECRELRDGTTDSSKIKAPRNGVTKNTVSLNPAHFCLIEANLEKAQNLLDDLRLAINYR